MNGLSDRTRLRIIKALMDREKTVSELVKELEGSQANISGHLKTLKTSGILKSRQEGKYVFYSLSDDAVHDFIMHLEETLIVLRQKAIEGF